MSPRFTELVARSVRSAYTRQEGVSIRAVGQCPFSRPRDPGKPGQTA
jgi:hypothetical protein